jgi:uncharacterized protein YcbK (DUF882 family)
MSDIGNCLAAFARLPDAERQRSIRLINAYNDAILESRKTHVAANKSFQSFSRNEVEQIVRDFRANRLTEIGPAMEHYLWLLDRGYRWPSLV